MGLGTRTYLFTTALCNLDAFFLLNHGLLHNGIQLPLKPAIHLLNANKVFFPGGTEGFLTVPVLLAVSYPLTIPMAFIRSSACEVIIGLVSESKVFLRLSALESIWLAWLHVI